MEQTKYDVFISYSRKDTAIVDRICCAFDATGITYFIDRSDIYGADEFPDVLAQAIINSKVFLFVASAHSYASKYSNSEVYFAYNHKEKSTILPYCIDKAKMSSGIALAFSSINIRNIETHPIETTLVEDVLHMLGREVAKKKVVKTETVSPKVETDVPHATWSACEWYTCVMSVIALLLGVFFSLSTFWAIEYPRPSDLYISIVLYAELFFVTVMVLFFHIAHGTERLKVPWIGRRLVILLLLEALVVIPVFSISNIASIILLITCFVLLGIIVCAMMGNFRRNLRSILTSIYMLLMCIGIGTVLIIYICEDLDYDLAIVVSALTGAAYLVQFAYFTTLSVWSQTAKHRGEKHKTFSVIVYLVVFIAAAIAAIYGGKLFSTM